MIDKVSSIWREVGLDKGVDIVVVTGINNRVAKDVECGNKRLSISQKKICCSNKKKRS